MSEADYEDWRRMRGCEDSTVRNIEAFRDAVVAMDASIAHGYRPAAESYMQLALLATRMYKPGDYHAHPNHVQAALQMALETQDYQVTSG